MTKPPPFDPMHLTDAMRESAQQIWLAGVGAFSKAQQEGGKVFENLVNDGLSIQRKTQAMAEEKWSQATQRMSDMAEQISNKTVTSVDRLETIFEDRVIKALIRQGYPTPQDWLALQHRVRALEEALMGASRAAAAGKAAARSGSTPATPAAAKKTRKASAAPAAGKSQTARASARSTGRSKT